MKFKSQLTIKFFAAVNHLSRPLRKQNLASTVSKGHVWDLPSVDFDPFWVFLCFQGSLLVIVIMIDGSEKHNCEGGF